MSHRDWVGRRAGVLLTQHFDETRRRTDRLFLVLMPAQWAAAIAAALWLSPRTWAGAESATHVHVWAAIVLGGAITALPVAFALWRPGQVVTRHVIALGQMVMSGLLIQLSGGRIETHFHVFGSLAFLAFYRDWRVLVTASAVTALDHYVRGAFWPQSVYGVLAGANWRWLEHAGWVVFEDVFLIRGVFDMRREMRQTAERQAEVEWTRQSVEEQVEARTLALKESEERFRSLSAQAPMGIFLTDEAGGCVYANERLQAITGTPAEALAGRGWSERVHPDDRARLVELWQHTFTTGDVFDDEHRFQTPTGETRCHVRACPLHGADGRLVGYVGTVEDVTAQYEMHETLARARDEALETARLKSEFLANMSHEIRTPMNGVMGMSGLLLDTPLDETQREYVAVIRNSAEGLLTVLNDILDFSKLAAGKMLIERVDFDVRELVEDVAELFAPAAHGKGLELVTTIDPRLATYCLGDPGRLRQVLTNLLGNAIKFTPKGEIVVAVKIVDERADDLLLHLEVSDTGIGIPEAQHDAVFQSFTQADGSMARRFGGTGLGLSISRQLVHLMDGEIGVDSTPGDGSRFWIELRLPKAPGAPAPQVTPAEVAGAHVLIVDDHAVNRLVLREQLRAWGFVPLEADGAAAAKRVLEEEGHRVALALIDLQMPDVDGLQLGAGLRDEPRWSEVPLVLLSSGGTVTEAQARAAGFHTVLQKPARQALLLRTIHAALGGIEGAVKRAPASVSPAAHFGLRVLVAEDNVVNQKLAERLLARLGCHAELVGTGIEALAALDVAPYDLVLMDVQMPEMDGLKATAAIRAGERGTARHIQIVALTAHALVDDRARCLEAGMDDYVSKPVRPAELHAALERSIERMRGGDAAAA